MIGRKSLRKHALDALSVLAHTNKGVEVSGLVSYHNSLVY